MHAHGRHVLVLSSAQPYYITWTRLPWAATLGRSGRVAVLAASTMSALLNKQLYPKGNPGRQHLVVWTALAHSISFVTLSPARPLSASKAQGQRPRVATASCRSRSQTYLTQETPWTSLPVTISTLKLYSILSAKSKCMARRRVAETQPAMPARDQDSDDRASPPSPNHAFFPLDRLRPGSPTYTSHAVTNRIASN